VKALRAVGLYALLTVILTWPLALRLRIMDPGDSAFFAWEIAWEIHALKTDPASLPHANIYHPARYALFMDEPVLGTMPLALPFSFLTDDAVLLFSLARLLTFVVSALTAYLLARELGCGEAAALFAGAAFAFSPIRTDQIAHLSTLGSQWLPLVLLFLVRFAKSGAFRHSLAAGLSFVLAAYACGYHGLIGFLVLPVAALPLVWGRWRRLIPAGVAAGCVGICLLPLYFMHREAMDPHGFVRADAEAVFYSASVESFLATTSWNRVYGELTTPFRTFSNNLFPGLVVPGLVAFAAVRLWRERRRPSREAVALGLLAFAAVVVALGPEVRFFGNRLAPAPMGFIRDAVPVFQKIRVSSRAGIYLALALAVLAALALRRFEKRPAVAAGLGALFLAEGCVAPIPQAAWADVIDTRRPIPPVYAWLAAQPEDLVIAELPMLESDGLFQRPAYDESIYMVWSTWHWKRLVNGYAGVEPATYRRVREAAWRFPSEAALDALSEVGTRYVVAHRGGFGPNQWARIERDLPAFATRLREVARFDGDTVFEIVAGAANAPNDPQMQPNRAP